MKRYILEGWNVADGVPINKIIEIEDNEDLNSILAKTDLNVFFIEIDNNDNYIGEWGEGDTK